MSKNIEDFLIGCEHDGSYIPIDEVKKLLKSAYNQALRDAARMGKRSYKKHWEEYNSSHFPTGTILNLKI